MKTILNQPQHLIDLTGLPMTQAKDLVKELQGQGYLVEIMRAKISNHPILIAYPNVLITPR